ncbi:MAG: LysR family transcriptional regulator [Pirellulales bacterium]
MHLRNLRVFCDVVNRRSFSQGAADNQMTQSGASQAVQQLEDYLQVQLIDRSKRPLVPTQEGELFHAGCVQILRNFEALTEEVRSIGHVLSGRASVAAIYSVGLSYLPQLQRLLKSRYPDAEVRYQFGQPEEVYRLVEQGLADFGLVSYPTTSKSITVTDWLQERMLLVASHDHRLTQVAEIQPTDLTDENLVAFAANLRIRHEIDRYLRHLGVTMQVAAEFDNIDSVKHAVGINTGIAFLPQPTVKEELAKGSMKMLNCPWLKLTRPLGLIQRRGSTLGRTARGVVELILSENFDRTDDPKKSTHPDPGEDGRPSRNIA